MFALVASLYKEVHWFKSDPTPPTLAEFMEASHDLMALSDSSITFEDIDGELQCVRSLLGISKDHVSKPRYVDVKQQREIMLEDRRLVKTGSQERRVRSPRMTLDPHKSGGPDHRAR